MIQKQLLLVDDDVEFTTLLSQYLPPQGYLLDVAHDGEVGLALASVTKNTI